MSIKDNIVNDNTDVYFFNNETGEKIGNLHGVTDLSFDCGFETEKMGYPIYEMSFNFKGYIE